MARNARSLAEQSYINTHWGDRGDRADERLRCADPNEKFYSVLGELYAVTYCTAKGGGLTELWEHEFHKTRPLLCYSPKSKLLLIAGGIYTVTARGIEK